MNVLILGGTRFIGPHFVEAALERGHSVTVFNRGLTQGVLPARVERLIGDRNGDLEALKNRDWDAVLDMATFGPRWIRALGSAVGSAIGHYTFISTINTYGVPSDTHFSDEHSPVLESREWDDPYSVAATATPTDPFEYGALKALCEQEAEAQFPGRALILRPGYMTGPGDPSQALAYWPLRLRRGGAAMAGGDADQPIQFIDVRDVAAWTFRLVEHQVAGVFNVVGPAHRMVLGDIVGVHERRDGTLTWVPYSWLSNRADADLWTQLLFWSSEFGGFAGTVDNGKALAHGLAVRPVSSTVVDCLDWVKEQREGFGLVGAPWDHYLAAEAAALVAWRTTDV